jgi:hypothetical protein
MTKIRIELPSNLKFILIPLNYKSLATLKTVKLITSSCMARETNAVHGLLFSGFRNVNHSHFAGPLGWGICPSQDLDLQRKKHRHTFILLMESEHTI